MGLDQFLRLVGAPERRLGPGADPGFRIGRDVRRVDRAEARSHRIAARVGRPALRRMAGRAIASTGHTSPRATSGGAKLAAAGGAIGAIADRQARAAKPATLITST